MAINSSLLKSPSVLSGASLAGAGGVGVGGGQIYEAVNSDVHEQLSKDGDFYSSISVPLENIPKDNKFNWKNWDCVNKLFPNVSINHEEPTESSLHLQPLKEGEYYLTAPEVKEDFIACALLDGSKGLSSSDNKEKIYFKSEVAVKGENYGWIMGNGLSTKPEDNKQTTNFEYRLLILKKEGSEGKIDKGFGWDNHVPNDSDSSHAFTIEIPEGIAGSVKNGDEVYSSRQVWSGIARVDKEAGENVKHLVNSMSIYMNYGSNKHQKAEFFGNVGRWAESAGVGYQKVGRFYDANDGKWKKLTQTIELGTSLEAWYEPFLNKSVKGMSSGDGCKHGAINRDKSLGDIPDYIDEAIKGMCYTKFN